MHRPCTEGTYAPPVPASAGLTTKSSQSHCTRLAWEAADTVGLGVLAVACRALPGTSNPGTGNIGAPPHRCSRWADYAQFTPPNLGYLDPWV